MIDLTTGKMEFNGIAISLHISLSDFAKYKQQEISIFYRGNGRGIVRLTRPVENNGIAARIKIEVNETSGSSRVIIAPVLESPQEMDLLQASKLWLRGQATGEYSEADNSISGKYGWGYLFAQYNQDRHYGHTGGEIIIVYAT